MPPARRMHCPKPCSEWPQAIRPRKSGGKYTPFRGKSHEKSSWTLGRTYRVYVTTPFTCGQEPRIEVAAEAVAALATAQCEVLSLTLTDQSVSVSGTCVE